MNYFNGNKRCLKEILDSVTAKDEATTLLILEYVKHYKGAVLGPVHKDGYGNTFFALPIIYNPLLIDDEELTWNSFREAKLKQEKQKNSGQKVFHLKKGLKIAFKHEMCLPDYYESGPHPKWMDLYGQWYKQMGEYRIKFISPEEKQQKYEAIQGIIQGSKNILKKS